MYVSHFLGQFLVWNCTICQDVLNFSHLHNSLWITFSTHLYMHFYFFCVRLLYSYGWQFHPLYHNLCGFCTPVLAGGFSLESEWQQVSRTLLNSLFNLNNSVIWIFSLLSLFDFQFPQSWDHSQCINYIWYQHHSHLPQFF